MDGDRTKKNGVIPIILYYIARTGNQVYSVNKLDLDSAGNLEIADDDQLSRVAHIRYLDNHSGQLRDIYYLSSDLSNSFLKKHPEISYYLANLPEGNTYLKAASYLCHHNYMSEYRSIILNKTKLILQEDTGIPYRFFVKDEWKIRLYGGYATPVKLFTDQLYRQADLKKDYKNSKNVRPLPFRLGYHSGSGNDNLMLAIRK